jgi:hypothetical protein
LQNDRIHGRIRTKNNYTRNTDLEQLFQPLLKNDVLDNSLNANIIINYGFGKSIVLPNYVSDILLELNLLYQKSITVRKRS